MNLDRRALMFAGATGAALAADGLGTAVAAPAPASLELRMEQTIAAREVENLINRYEVLLGEAYIKQVYQLFSTAPDVQADVGFGQYYGPTGMKTLFLELHGKLVGDADTTGAKPGAFYCLENTTGVVEVAQDLATARGLWYGAAYSTVGDPQKGFRGYYGMARRAVDFIRENGEWRIWHYYVYGLLYAPIGESYTDPSVYEANAQHNFTFPGALAPSAPPPDGIGPKYTWRPDKALKAVLPPVPYRTFSESASYAIPRT